MTAQTELPAEDQRWLSFVQRYNRILRGYSQFAPLRRYIYSAVYEAKRPARVYPDCRRYARYLKQLAFRLRNEIHFRNSNVIIWQDIERDYMYNTINMLQDMLNEKGLSSIPLMKSSLKRKHLMHTPIKIYPDVVPHLPLAAYDFMRLVLNEFGAESKTNMQPYLEKHFRAFYGYSQVFQSVIDKVKPEAVLFPYDQYLPSATLASIARLNGIKTFGLQQGAANPYQFPPQADKFLVWGEQDRQYFRELGMPEDAIVVTGSVRHDDFTFQKNLRTPKKRILLISNGNNEDRNGHLPRIAYEWLRNLKSESQHRYRFYVRYHPGEKEELRALGTGFEQSLNGIPIDSAIKEADIVVGYVSTALLESSLIGRPVIQLLDHSARYLCDFWKQGVAIGVWSYDEFRTWIYRLCGSDKEYDSVVSAQRHHIRRYFHNHPRARTSMLEVLAL